MRFAQMTIVAVLSVLMLGAQCRGEDEERLTLEEAQLALEESNLSTEMDNLTSAVVEISTNFTIGDAVDAAVQELQAWAHSQIPCSTIAAEGTDTVVIDFGELGDDCVYEGKTYAGVVKVKLTRLEVGAVEVEHEWIGLTNGRVTVDGTATVTWDGAAGTRRVVHQATWSNDKTTATGTGDRTQSFIDPALRLAGGIRVDGERQWTSDRGAWHLDIDNIEMRLQDPAPQAGGYTLTNPNDKTLTLSYSRVDDDTIAVTLTASGGGSFTFHITHTGATQA